MKCFTQLEPRFYRCLGVKGSQFHSCVVVKSTKPGATRRSRCQRGCLTTLSDRVNSATRSGPGGLAKDGLNKNETEREDRVRELMPADVRTMAEAAGLPMTDDDLSEVTHRLNAFLEALAPLASLALEQVEPWPTLPDIP